MSGLLKVLIQVLTLFVKGAKPSQVVSEKKNPEPPQPNQDKPEILFKNDSERLKKEYGDLYERNRHLYDVIIETAHVCYHWFNKNIVITMIYRTDQEQDSIYKDDPKYKVKKFKSPHQFFHGVDLRSSTFEPHEIEKLVNYLNRIYNETNYYNFTAKCHAVINGAEHFHIQFVKK